MCVEIMMFPGLGGLRSPDNQYFSRGVSRSVTAPSGGLAFAVNCYQSQVLKHFNDPAAELQVRPCPGNWTWVFLHWQ